MGAPSGFDYVLRKNGEILITHHGRQATVLRGQAAERFLIRIRLEDPQQLMARITGNYKRGNERR
jgi:hypothetical protein